MSSFSIDACVVSVCGLEARSIISLYFLLIEPVRELRGPV